MRVSRRSCLVLTSILVLLAAAGPARGQSVPEGFRIVPINTQLDYRSVGFAFLPDERILLINHQSGDVKVIVDGTLSPEPLVTIPRLVTSSEQGLLGIAVDPDFPDANYVYLFHTRDDSTNRVTRFTVEGDLDDADSDRLSIDLASGQTLIAMPDTTKYHNGGTLRFGSDKTLYVSHGDDVRYQWIQDLTTLYGKILRINRDGSIPDDNPVFPSEPEGKRSEVFTFGLRNPFRFSIDPATERLFIGDVGTNLYEELNLSVGGENFGYPRYEGPGFFRKQEPLIAPEPTFPAYTYAHGSAGRAVIALVTYRQSDYPNDHSFPPEYDGAHFFTDYFDDALRYLAPDGQGGWTHQVFGQGFNRVVDAALGSDGSIYLLEYGGRLYKIVYEAPDAVPVAEAEVPGAFALEPNYPNPFARETTIPYTLPEPQHVRLDVFDVRGRRVATLVDAWQAAGSHTARFEAGALPQGAYFYRLQAGARTAMKAMIRVTQ